MAVTQQSCELSSAAADSVTRPTPRLSFVTDIQQMMCVLYFTLVIWLSLVTKNNSTGVLHSLHCKNYNKHNTDH